MQLVKYIDEIFNIPLLVNEGFCIGGIPFGSFCLFYIEDGAIIAIGIMALILLNLLYCVFRQNMIEAAYEFKTSLYNLD